MKDSAELIREYTSINEERNTLISRHRFASKTIEEAAAMKTSIYQLIRPNASLDETHAVMDSALAATEKRMAAVAPRATNAKSMRVLAVSRCVVSYHLGSIYIYMCMVYNIIHMFIVYVLVCMLFICYTDAV